MNDYIKRIRTETGDKQIDYTALANLPVSDKTLSVSGKFADAKETGDRIEGIREYLSAMVRPTTWNEIVKTIETGLHRNMYAIGDKFTNIWSDPNASMKEYDNPLRINHFQDGLELENGQLINGMWLQTQYAQLKGVQLAIRERFFTVLTVLHLEPIILPLNRTGETM